MTHTFFTRFCVVIAAFVVLGSAVAQAQFLRDAEIEQYLEDYSHPLFDAAGLPTETVGIHLIGDPSLNAFVSNGLNMFIFTGLIVEADTPNQIEGVIAHETGHMSGGHLLRNDEAMKSASRPMILSLALGAAAIAAGSTDAGLAAIALGQTVGQANYLSYSRGQEARSDQAALGFLEEVGHSGVGLVEFFAKLRNRQLITANEINPYYVTHPLAGARISALETRVKASPFADVKDSDAEMFRLKMIQGKINGFMQSPHTTLRQYPLTDKSQPALYARAVAYYRASDLEKATREIDRLIEAQPENPFFWELKGQMLFEHGKVQQAIAPHRKSVEYGAKYALLKINLARALNATDFRSNTDEAISILKIALDIEPDNSFGWTELARAYGTIENIPLANLATAEAHFHRGSAQDATRFAKRAEKDLAQGTAEWQQANDIIVASAKNAKREQQQRRRRNLKYGP